MTPDFYDFQQELHTSRYLPTERKNAYLEKVGAESRGRLVRMTAGSRLWRAQIGAEVELYDPEDLPLAVPSGPLGHVRMIPDPKMTREGRASPAGAPVLYLASDRETAMSEVRPWVGVDITVAEFALRHDLDIVDLTARSPEETEGSLTEVLATWPDLDRGFSRPVQRSEHSSDYAATQTIAELFRQLGFDGIQYRSSLGQGMNVVLFDLDAAEIRRGAVFRVHAVQFEFGRTLLIDEMQDPDPSEERWFPY